MSSIQHVHVGHMVSKAVSHDFMGALSIVMHDAMSVKELNPHDQPEHVKLQITWTSFEMTGISCETSLRCTTFREEFIKNVLSLGSSQIRMSVFLH